MTKRLVIYNGDDTETELPVRWEICSHCEGCATDRGANVECDGGGFTSSEWAEQDDDFKEGYLRGDYDKPCSHCAGLGRVQVPDFDKMTPKLRKAWDAQAKDDDDYERLCRMERMMGA